MTPREDGKLDIEGAGFDTIFARRVPARHRRLVIAIRVLVSRHEAEHSHRLDVVLQGADGAELARAEAPVEVPEDVQQRVRPGRRLGLGLIVNFDDVVFPVFGDYQLVIQWDTNEARSPIHLSVLEQAA